MSSNLICPECESDDISQTVVDNKDCRECQDCYHTWSPNQSSPKYPKVEVQLSGEDGNAFAILGRVSGALRKADIPNDEIKKFQEEATSGDYDNLLQVCMKWVTVRLVSH